MAAADWVTVQHGGIVLDDESDEQFGEAVRFTAPWDEEFGVAWVPRGILQSYDETEMVIPEWKAEEFGAEYTPV